jgi:protein-tyrosine phosphatase
MTSVLMVCTGNICRSPAAEEVLRTSLAKVGARGITVDSAGTGGWHSGELPHEHSRSVGKSRGYVLNHRARVVTDDDFINVDLFVAMDSSHAQWLTQRAYELGVEISMRFLRSFDPACLPRTDLADPWGHPTHAYEVMYDQIQSAMPGLVVHLLGE